MRLWFALITSNNASARAGSLVGEADAVLDQGAGDPHLEVLPIHRLAPEVHPRGRGGGKAVQAADEIGDFLPLAFGDDAIGDGVLQHDAVQRLLDAVQAGVTGLSFGLLGLISSSRLAEGQVPAGPSSRRVRPGSAPAAR